MFVRQKMHKPSMFLVNCSFQIHLIITKNEDLCKAKLRQLILKNKMCMWV